MVTKKTVKKTVKKAVAKSPVKKVVKKVAAKVKKPAPMKSFKVYRNNEPFTTFRVSRQTVYWLVLLLFIVITQLWILKLQLDIASLTDSILNQ